METSTSRHILLNELFAEVKLNVIVNGGGYTEKEVAASVMILDDCLEICHVKYGKTLKL